MWAEFRLYGERKTRQRLLPPRRQGTCHRLWVLVLQVYERHGNRVRGRQCWRMRGRRDSDLRTTIRLSIGQDLHAHEVETLSAWLLHVVWCIGFPPFEFIRSQ